MTRREMLMYAMSAVGLGITGALYGCGSAGPSSSTPGTPQGAQSGSTTATSATSAVATTENVPAPPASTSTTASATFVQPPLLASSRGALEVGLTTAFASNKVAGQSITTRTYNGQIGGPTLRVNPGDVLRINLSNNFPATSGSEPGVTNSTNIHPHGLHVPPADGSDNILDAVKPGAQLQYEFRIPTNHPSGTFFYHPLVQGESTPQFFGGMGGALIVAGGVDNVPEVAAATDFVFLINELNVDTNGAVPTASRSKRRVARAHGDGTGPAGGFNSGGGNSTNGAGPYPLSQRFLTVNGEVTPTLDLAPGQVVRLRVINATPRTFIPLQAFSHSLHVIALDGVTLPSTRTLDTVSLAPGNRADILIQAGAPGTYAIQKNLYRTGATLPSGAYTADPPVVLALLNVRDVPAVSMSLPTSLPVPPALTDIADSEITHKRTINFCVNAAGADGSSPSFTIDGAAFNPSVVNHTVSLNSAEEWTLVNQEGVSSVDHPFHLHTNPFQVVAVNGVPLAQPEWHDTINIPNMGSVTIRSRFQDFRGISVFHCHHAMHQDLGMMQTVQIV